MAVRFSWLDAARGVAAISVMIYHYEPIFHFAPLFGSSYLAVDLFFIMSGFVLAHSYGGKLLSGRMSFADFVAARLIRLWPLYAAATALGASYYASKLVMGLPDAPPGGAMAMQFLLNILFIPAPADLPQVGGIFPYSPAAWSLSAEMVGSLLFGALLVRTGTRLLSAAAALLLLALTIRAVQFGTLDMGWGRTSLGGGLLRMTAEMSVGLLIHRLHQARLGSRAWHPAWLAACSLAAFAAFSIVSRGNVAAEMAFVFLLFPVLIALAARTDAPQRAHWLCEQLGRLSYPIYLLHVPVLLWVSGVWKMGFGLDPDTVGPLAGWSAVVAVLLCSMILLRFFDEPLRARLNAAMRRRTTGRALQVGSASTPLGRL